MLRNPRPDDSTKAEMLVSLSGARSSLRGLVQLLDERLEVTESDEKPATAGLRASPFEVYAECNAAAMQVERCALRAVDHAMMLAGGASYSTDHVLSRLVRDVRAVSFMRPASPPIHWAYVLAAANDVF